MNSIDPILLTILRKNFVFKSTTLTKLFPTQFNTYDYD